MFREEYLGWSVKGGVLMMVKLRDDGLVERLSDEFGEKR